MPHLIQHVDTIARENGKDILLVRFTRVARIGGMDWERCKERKDLVRFLIFPLSACRDTPPGQDEDLEEI